MVKQPTAPETQLLKVPEVKALTGYSRQKIYDLINEGEIPAVRHRRTIRIWKPDLDEFIQKNRGTADRGPAIAG